MSLETSLSNIMIKGNTIDQGRFSDGASPVAYTYNYNAWIFGSSIIEGNTFSGPAASTDMLNVDTCSCTITGNKFVRGSTTINSYIRNYGSNDQIITNNIFDKSTINGGIDGYTTVKGLSSASTFHSNKNQAIYVSILLGVETYQSVLYARLYQDTGSYAGNGNIYTEVGLFDTNNQYFIVTKNLGAHLPDGIRIDELKVGVLGYIYPGSVISATASDNQLDLSVSAVDNMSTNYNSGTSSLLDVQYQFALTGGGDFAVDTTVDTTYDIHGNMTAMQGSTQYITLPIGDENFRNTKDRLLLLNFVQSMKLSNATGGGIVWKWSPILARCIW